MRNPSGVWDLVAQSDLALGRADVGHRIPTDCLSDGYNSSDDQEQSQRVVKLLQSGVRARQADQISLAKSDYARARAMQSSRGRKASKLRSWLEGVAKVHGKDRVRLAAQDIQRVYQGMLGRMDVRYERMVLRKQRAAGLREAGAQTLQRLWRGHWARLRAKWRLRLRREEVAAARCMQAHFRAALQRLALARRRTELGRAHAVLAAAWRCRAARGSILPSLAAAAAAGAGAGAGAKFDPYSPDVPAGGKTATTGGGFGSPTVVGEDTSADASALEKMLYGSGGA